MNLFDRPTQIISCSVSATGERRDATDSASPRHPRLPIRRAQHDRDEPVDSNEAPPRPRLSRNELQNGDSLLRIASRLGHLGAWSLESPELKLTWSDEVRAIHEVPADYNPSLAPAYDFYAPECRGTIRDAVAACLQDGAPFDLELQLVTFRGRHVWVRAIGEAERDRAGAIVRIHGAFQDISDRKVQAERNRELTERLTATFESITDGLLILDREWRVTYVNRVAEGLLQRSRAALLGKMIWNEFPEARGSVFEREYHRALAENIPVRFEEPYQPLDLWLEVRAFPSPSGLAIYFRDITERRRADENHAAALLGERKARQEADAAKAHFRTLFEFIPGLYLVLTPENFSIVGVSDAYLRATMTTRDGLIGRTIFEAFPDNPDEPEADGTRNLRASLERVRRSKIADTMPLQRYPIRRPQADGGEFEERFWSPFNSPVFGTDEKLAYIIHRVEDVTEFVRLKQQEGAWREDQRVLETKLGRMEADLVLRAKTLLTLNEQLHLSEQRFRAMFSDAAAGIAILDSSRRVVQANPAFCALTNYREEELREMDLQALILADDWLHCDELLRRLVAHKMDSCAFQARYLRNGGSVVWIGASVSIVRGRRDEPLQFVVVVQDISECKRAQFALQQRERHYRLLFDRNPQPMWVFDLETLRFLAVNAAAVADYGYTEAEFLAMSIEDIRPAEDKQRLHDMLRLPPGSARELWRHRKKNGAVIDVEVIGDTIEFGARRARLVVVSDVTERRRAEARIGRQAALIDQANDAIVVRDFNHVVQFWSQGAERLYGWTAAEAVGRRIDELTRCDSGTLDQALRCLKKSGDWSAQLDEVSKNGRRIVVAVRCSLLRNEQGEPEAVLVIKADVTERKQIEAQYLRAQRMESLGTLASGIAHDLNNLLAPVVMGLGLLKLSPLSEGDRRIVETMERSSERGTGLVRQILTFARGAEGARVTLNIRHLINEVELIVAGTFPKNIELATNCPKEVGLISGDPTQLHQVLLNLCVNARDAMPSGGKLSISARNERVDEQFVTMQRDITVGDYVVIEVADTGTGIPKENLEKIFEPFFTTKDLGQGTGLGLATSLGIVRSHRGFVNVQSDVGHGTCFKVYIPLQAEPGDLARSARPAVELPRGNGEWVLFVDDEAGIRSITRQTLEAFGYNVISAEDGVQAVGKFASNKDKIAVVVTDLMMPLMDGHAVFGAIRHLTADVPVVATSGVQTKAEMTKVVNAGFCHFIAKPFSAEALLQAVGAAIRAASAKQPPP